MYGAREAGAAVAHVEALNVHKGPPATTRQHSLAFVQTLQSAVPPPASGAGDGAGGTP
jgi:hypothetical protein